MPASSWTSPAIAPESLAGAIAHEGVAAITRPAARVARAIEKVILEVSGLIFRLPFSLPRLTPYVL